jgi:hypothetical protein
MTIDMFIGLSVFISLYIEIAMEIINEQNYTLRTEKVGGSLHVLFLTDKDGLVTSFYAVSRQGLQKIGPKEKGMTVDGIVSRLSKLTPDLIAKVLDGYIVTSKLLLQC